MRAAEGDGGERIRLIGKGTHGSVFLRHDDRGWTAIKRVPLTLTRSENLSVVLMREVDCLKAIGDHPHVTSLREMRVSDENVFLFMDYCPSTLRAIMQTSSVLCPSFSRRALLGLLAGLEHCHSLHIIHRDIKPENLLVDDRGNTRIADFGLARRLFVTLDDAEQGAYTPGMVTIWYRSRELLLGEPYGADVDVWSAGCVFYEMRAGRVLFGEDSELAMLRAIATTLDSDPGWASAVGALTSTEADLVRESLAPSACRPRARELFARVAKLNEAEEERSEQ